MCHPRREGVHEHGDKVVAEITSFPRIKDRLAGRVIKVMGKPEDPQSDVEAIIEEFNLPRKFPRKFMKSRNCSPKEPFSM